MLSRTSEYALRAVVFIFHHSRDDQPVLAKDVATQAQVPLKYLQKILRQLVHNGVLRSVRGLHGGYVLAQTPQQIHLWDVLAPFEPSLRGSACPFGNLQCGVANPCPIHHQWEPIVAAYRHFLESTTLGDLAELR